MNLDDDDESVFERALRADLPTSAQQDRLRQRMLAAGLAAGAALGSSNVAAAQASFGASALSKLSALSWPAKLGLAAVIAAPVGAIPLVQDYAPVRAAAMVSQVRSSAATVHARSATKAALLPADSQPLAAPPATPFEPEPSPATVSARLTPPTVNNPSPPATATPMATPIATANGNTLAPQPAVATFDSLAHDAAANESERLRNASTLAAETQLLDRAFAALAAGDRSTAQALVAEHARLFPKGLLSQERERARARLALDPKGE